MRTQFLGLGLGLTTLTALLPLGVSANSITCNTSGPMGYSVTASAPRFHAGTNVSFCLADRTRVPLFFGTSHPWVIENSSGNIIYTPPPGDLGPPATFTFIDTWNGRDQSGNIVPHGLYSIVFPGLPETPSTTIRIIGHARDR